MCGCGGEGGGGGNPGRGGGASAAVVVVGDNANVTITASALRAGNGGAGSSGSAGGLGATGGPGQPGSKECGQTDLIYADGECFVLSTASPRYHCASENICVTGPAGGAGGSGGSGGAGGAGLGGPSYAVVTAGGATVGIDAGTTLAFGLGGRSGAGARDAEAKARHEQ